MPHIFILRINKCKTNHVTTEVNVMTMANTKKETLELVQLSLEELGLVTGGRMIDRSRYMPKRATPDNKPPRPYFPT